MSALWFKNPSYKTTVLYNNNNNNYYYYYYYYYYNYNYNYYVTRNYSLLSTLGSWSIDPTDLLIPLLFQEYCYDNMNFMKVFQKMVLLFYKSKP